MNCVSLIGRITKDVELRTTGSGISGAGMFLAINNGKDENGNDRPADFPKIYVYGKQAENVSKFCKKGSQIAVAGKIKTRTYDKNDGSKGYETYVLANRVQFLDSKPSEGTSLPEPDYVPVQEERDPFDELDKNIVLSDSDLPF